MKEDSNPETCILDVYWQLRVSFYCLVMISQRPWFLTTENQTECLRQFEVLCIISNLKKTLFIPEGQFRHEEQCQYIHDKIYNNLYNYNKTESDRQTNVITMLLSLRESVQSASCHLLLWHLSFTASARCLACLKLPVLDNKRQTVDVNDDVDWQHSSNRAWSK